MATTSARAGAFRIAKRLDEVGFSDIVVIRNKVMELRAAGQTVHAFHGGEPFFETPEVIKQALFTAAEENKTRYAPSSGIAPLREALVDKLRERNHLQTTPDQVIVTVGGAHALYCAFQAVLDPGSDCLLFSPYWTPIADMIRGAQAHPLFVPTAAARRSGITATLEQLTTPETRAIYYNTPQNPSGVVFTRAEAEEVAEFARRHNLIVIADEAYEDLVYDGEHVSIASLPGMEERTISTYTFSKSYAMTGWRIGYAVAQEPFMTAMRKLVLYSTNGVATMVQWAALDALQLSAEFRQKTAGRVSRAARCAGERAERDWLRVRSCRRARSTPFQALPGLAGTAARRQPCCWTRHMWPPFPAPSLAARARVMYASATPPRWRRFSKVSTHCAG